MCSSNQSSLPPIGEKPSRTCHSERREESAPPIVQCDPPEILPSAQNDTWSYLFHSRPTQKNYAASIVWPVWAGCQLCFVYVPSCVLGYAIPYILSNCPLYRENSQNWLLFSLAFSATLRLYLEYRNVWGSEPVPAMLFIFSLRGDVFAVPIAVGERKQGDMLSPRRFSWLSNRQKESPVCNAILFLPLTVLSSYSSPLSTIIGAGCTVCFSSSFS